MISNYNDHKRYLIMNIINHLGAVSRTDLAMITGYQPATISAITKQLMEEHILTETGSYSSGPGRKRTLLELDKNHLCAITISFSPTEITLTITQFDGMIIDSIGLDFPKTLSESDFLSHIITPIKQLIEEYNDRNIMGIGICSPPNEPDNYPIANLTFLKTSLRRWTREVLLSNLQETVSIPVSAFRGTTLAVMAEKNFGTAKGIDDFICVELSNGIGSSICCNGKAVTGASYHAGEIGHTIIEPNSNLCYCGKHGCVESYASFPELVKAIRGALEQKTLSKLNYASDTEITAKDIRLAIEKGDLICRYYVKESAKSIGIAISNMVALLDPKLIVLHGHMLELGDYFLDVLKNTIYDNTPMESKIEITISPELEKSLPLGAVAEIYSQYIKKDSYNWIYQ